MRCDLRTHRECGCPVGSCQQRPRSPDPVILTSVVDILSNSVVLAAIALFFTFVSIPMGVEADRKHQIENQENVSWRK
jgi:hypothetical protein